MTPHDLEGSKWWTMVTSTWYQLGTGDELTIAERRRFRSPWEMGTQAGWGVGGVAIAVIVAAPVSVARALVGDADDGGPPSVDSMDAGSDASEPAEDGATATASEDAEAPTPSGPPRRSVMKDAQRALGLTLRREPTLRIGPRFGGTLNFDQWLFGGQILGDSIGIDAFGLEAMFVLGVGGNHVTLRPAARMLYTLWIGGHRGLGIAPTVGASALIYVPVGDFAKFCNRVDLHGCGGWDLGMDVGGSLRFRWFRLEATLGFFGIPKATITFAVDFPVGRRTEGVTK